MVYHDQKNRIPEWTFPEFPEYVSNEWTPFRRATSWKIRTHVQEMCENGMDNAHFPFLHSQQTKGMRTEKIEVDGPFFIHRTFQLYNIFGLAKLFVDEINGPLDVHLYGLGCALNRARVDAKIQLCYSFAFFFTPIDEERIEVYSMLSMTKLPNRLITNLLTKKAIHEGKQTIGQDVPIWENKCFHQVPLLCDSDGPIMRFRKWTAQFYIQE